MGRLVIKLLHNQTKAISHKAVWRIILVVASTCSFSACFTDSLHTLSGNAVDGRVLEEGTGKPIAGAIVVVTWSGDSVPTGFTAVNSLTVCYHAETAITDDSGRYHIPAWKQKATSRIKDGHSSSMAYKLGYSWRPGVEATIMMTPFAGTREERFRVFEYQPRCFFAGASRRNLYPMLKSMYEEMQQLAQSDIEKGWVKNIRRAAADAAVAVDGDAHDDADTADRKVNDFLKDNLP